MSDKETYKRIPVLRFPDFANDEEWKKDTFENIFLFLPNNTLSRAELNYENGSTKNVHYGDVLIRFGDCLDVQTNVLPFISDEAVADRLQRSGLQDGDVVIADTAEDETVGKCTEIYNVSGENVVSGLHTIPIRPKKQFAVPYLGFYINSDSYRKQLLPLMQGVKVMSISKTAIGKTIVAYPNLLSEQCKIGSCLSSLDTYISATKEKLELLKTYKKGLMQKLFPAKGKKLPELRFKEFEKDGEWEEKMLGEIGETYTGLSGKDKNDFGHGEAEYITYMNVFSNPIAKKEMNQPIEIDGKQHSVRYGDVFFTTSSETPEEVGMSSIWLEDKENVYLNSFCFGYRLKEKFDNIYMSYYFRSEYFREKMIVLAQGISRYNISKNKAMQLPFQYPSLLEQRKIADSLTSIDLIINQYTNKVTYLRQYKNGLMQQLFPPSK